MTGSFFSNASKLSLDLPRAMSTISFEYPVLPLKLSIKSVLEKIQKVLYCACIDRLKIGVFLEVLTPDLNTVYKFKVHVKLDYCANQIPPQYTNIRHLLLIHGVRKRNQRV